MTEAELQRAQKLAPLLIEIADIGTEIQARLQRLHYSGPISIVVEDKGMLETAKRVAGCRMKNKEGTK